ncbi:MAG: succinyl-diaminopimelate desuccinylase [Methylococcaceae bacterium]|nr:succinyl-diaminopimelate desuccinylase [Methylococcaceae bacterium]
MTLTEQLLRQLIGRPSLTPDDAGCMEILSERLCRIGFQSERFDFGNTRNIWLKKGRSAPLFTFLGHSDVVEPGPLEEWNSPPFEATSRNGFLYGRGAADMKSGIAAFVTACERFCGNHPGHNGSISLLITSDEEGTASHGTIKVIECLMARNEKIDWCLVGEPSSNHRAGDTIKIGRRGSLCGNLKIRGIQGHVAYPHLAENPVHRFAPVLHSLTNEIWDRGNQYFPATSFQISNIQAGTGAENIIPGKLEVQFNFRFSTQLDEDTIKARVHKLLDDHRLNYELHWRLSGRPFLTRETELLEAAQQALVAITGIRAGLETGGGTSDGRFVAPTGAQVIELGPSNESIHKINEKIRLEDLEILSLVYEKTLENLLVESS